MSRSFADTVDLPMLTDAVDLLVHLGLCDCLSTSLKFCTPADAVDLPMPWTCRSLLTPGTSHLLVNAVDLSFAISRRGHPLLIADAKVHHLLVDPAKLLTSR